MDERLKFVARLLDGEKMSPLCREFGIARKTGYKLFNRYKKFALRGLEDRPRRPYRHANKPPFQIEKTILAIKREHPTRGAPKIRDKLLREFAAIKPGNPQQNGRHERMHQALKREATVIQPAAAAGALR